MATLPSPTEPPALPAELALRAALDAWRETRAPEVADQIDTITRDALNTFHGPRARTRDEFQAAWLRLAQAPDALTTGWLATNLTRLLRVDADHFGVLDPNYARRKYACFFERLQALEALEPDPRIAGALTTILVEAPWSAWDARSAHLIYGPIAEFLSRSHDVRAIARLTHLLESPRATRASVRDELARILPETLEALARVPVTMPAGERARWSSLRPATSPALGTTSGAALLAAVHARPDDDEVRLVYADWLLERGDELGDFIALQVREARGAGREADTRRARALLKAHRDDWLGDLSRVFARTEYVRGFLDSAVLAQNAAATAATWEKAPNAASLRTLRVLEQGRASARHYASFVLSLMSSNLEAVELPVASLLEQLAKGPPRKLTTVRFRRMPNLALLKLLHQSNALEHVTALDLPLDDNADAKLLSALHVSGMSERLEWLKVRLGWGASPSATLRGLKPSLLEPGTLSRLTLEAMGSRCELDRRSGKLIVTLVDDGWTDFAPTLLDTLGDVGPVQVRLGSGPRANTTLAALETNPRVQVERLTRSGGTAARAKGPVAGVPATSGANQTRSGGTAASQPQGTCTRPGAP